MSGKVKAFAIELDDPSATYHAGQTLSGKIKIILTKEMQFRGIFVHLQGKTKISWSSTATDNESSDSDTDNQSETRSDSHTHFNLKFSIPGTKGLTKLGPGHYNYPFSTVLPRDLPSSLKGHFGCIRYICSSNIARPYRLDPKCKTTFNVLAHVDLNEISNATVPLSLSQSKAISGVRGSVLAKVTIDKQAYVPGDSICIQAEIDNSTGIQIPSTQAELSCIISCATGANKEGDKQVMKQMCRNWSVLRGRSQWVNKRMEIPPVATTCSGNEFPFIRVEHYFTFTVNLSKMRSADLELSMPIVVGSIRLRGESGSSEPVTAVPPDLTTRTRSSSLPSSLLVRAYPRTALLETYSELPPPSYEECVRGQV